MRTYQIYSDIKKVKPKVNRELICLQHPQPKSFGEGNAAIKICEAIINGGNVNE